MIDHESVSEPAVSIVSVSKRFGRQLALDGITLNVSRASLFALLGPNGAGKSTLIDIVCTITRPDAGTARVGGFDVVDHPRQARKSIGVVFQNPTLDTRLTVAENLAFHGMIYHMGRRDRRARASELLKAIGLEDRAEHTVATLSSGMRRRLEIARALMHRPKILFMDEPTVGLDAQSRQSIWSIVDGLRRSEGVTTIVTTHYIEEVETCDSVAIIDGGRIIASGDPNRLRSDHGTMLARATLRTQDDVSELLAAYPNAVADKERHVTIAIDNQEAVASLLGRFGSRFQHVSFDQPSLESVFLELTGRTMEPGRRPAGTVNG